MLSCFIIVLPAAQFLPFFFFNDTATTEIYTLSLHDALPISGSARFDDRGSTILALWNENGFKPKSDRKSTRLNSSHQIISYAVFCLKKKTARKATMPQSRANRKRRIIDTAHDSHSHTAPIHA